MRDKFYGTFSRIGAKTGYKGPEPTILLLNVTRASDNKIVTEHLWFNLINGFKDAKLKEGDIVEFTARVKEYEKGYKGYRVDVPSIASNDYKLSHPTKVSKVFNSDK